MSSTDVLMAGAIAAFTVDLLVYPLDTLKTRLQSPRHRHLPLLRGLYQGLGPVILATLPAASTFFTVYNLSRSHLPRHPLSDALASSIAEACSCAILTPAEVIKQNAQVIPRSGRQSPQSTSVRAFCAIKRTRDLWTGYGALVARNLPYTAMQFPVFEAMKARLCLDRSGVWETMFWAGVAAGSSGGVAAVVTTPVDVVKTRIMLAAGDHRRVVDVVKEVLREEGYRGLWRGGALRTAWTMMGSGLYLGVYEGSKVWLTRRREEKNGEISECL